MGRVNTRLRFRYAFHLGCDSIDGSGFSRWPDQRVPVGLRWLAELDGKPKMLGTDFHGNLFRGGDPFAARGWSVDSISRALGGYVVLVNSSGGVAKCPVCENNSHNPPYRHGSRTRVVWDKPHDGTPVKLIIRRSRYRCRACHSVFVPRCLQSVETCPVTRELAAWLIRQGHLTQEEIARQVGVSPRTLRKWLQLV
jgi:hypothetical protein